MSGSYLQVGQGPLGLWRWWLTNSLGSVIYRGPYAYESRQGAVKAGKGMKG
jgi:hypothetical protein